MDLAGIMLSEVSLTEKNTYCMTSLTCGMQKLKQTSEYNKQKKKQTHREQVSGY